MNLKTNMFFMRDNFKNKGKRKKNLNKNQTSFYFEDYLETNNKIFKKKISNSRSNLFIIFFIFFINFYF